MSNIQTDGRRRQYVPLYVRFATGDTGQKILEKYGAEGIGVWAALLAAAKRSNAQGTLEWASEIEAWDLLGMRKRPPGFSFDEFVRFLGRLHKVRTTTSGEVKTTSIRAWNDWNTTIERDKDATRKRRKRAQITPDEKEDNPTTLEGTEVEGEGETPLPPLRKRKQRVNGHLRRATPTYACPRCGTDQRNATDLDNHLEWSTCSGKYDDQPASPEGAAA